MSYAVHKQTNKQTNRWTKANDYITSVEGGGYKQVFVCSKSCGSSTSITANA